MISSTVIENRNVFCAIFVIYSLLHLTTPYKILMVSPQFPSHVLEQVAMGSVLLEAGHEVHLVLESRFDSNIAGKLQAKGFHFHIFHEPDSFLGFSSEEYKKDLCHQIFSSPVTLISQMPVLAKLVNQECTYMMEDERFLKKLREIKFDLAIVEAFALHMCCLILPKYLNIPFVTLTNTYVPFDIRVPALPSFYPRQFFGMDNQKIAPFHVRFSQLLINIFFSSRLSPMNRNLTLLHKYAPDVPTWEDLLRQSLLFFSEVDHHFNTFFPSLPNHVSVAGMTCHPAKPLPENILKFIKGRIVDGKEPGLILMTFGSQASYMPKSIVRKFLNAFASLNETVIVKFSIEEKDREIPPNVLVSNWLPQNDILGYPATQLFITHCGNNGQHEALYHGVPMLGFPLFAEQAGNCLKSLVNGFGLKMDIFKFTENELVENILEILRNRKYKQAIQHMSNVFKDQPMTAQQRALFWVKHVIKHGGGHLRSSAMDLPLYQFLCFDTVGMLLMLLAIVVMVVYKILKMVTVKFYKWVKSRRSLEKKKQK